MKKEYQQLLGEFNSTSTYSLVDFIFIGLNDKFIRENRDIDESIMLDEKIFNTMNKRLEQEWEDIKKRYDMKGEK